MASVRTFSLPHYDAYPVHVASFKDVTNAAFLRTQLLQGNPDFDYAFLDATMVVSPAHLLKATFLALHSTISQRAKTRTPHSELVFRLSPNNNIGESYKKFGISDDTSSIIAVKLNVRGDGSVDESVSAESVAKHLGDAVKGVSVEIDSEGSEIGESCDLNKVRKVYKLTDMSKGGKKAPGVVNGDKDVEEKKKMESVILGIIALKGT